MFSRTVPGAVRSQRAPEFKRLWERPKITAMSKKRYEVWWRVLCARKSSAKLQGSGRTQENVLALNPRRALRQLRFLCKPRYRETGTNELLLLLLMLQGQAAQHQTHTHTSTGPEHAALEPRGVPRSALCRACFTPQSALCLLFTITACVCSETESHKQKYQKYSRYI